MGAASQGGFIEGAYTGNPTAPTNSSGQTPLNAFNNVIILGRTADYLDDGVPSLRLNLVLGRGVPVDVAREADVKLDDGRPMTGVVRLANDDPGNVFGALGASDPGCLDLATSQYDIAGDVQDCNLVYLY